MAAVVVILPKKSEAPAPVGGDRDEHGCLVAAGYAYDETVGACIRAFEMTPDIKSAAREAVAYVGGSHALTVASFNSYEEKGSYDIMLERGVERTPITVVIIKGVVTKPSLGRVEITTLLSKQIHIAANTIIATVDTDLGDFAKGQVHFTESSDGGIWFAAKTSAGWELAFSGNGIITCDIADRYAFPNTLVPTCISTTPPRDLIRR